jgi:recombination protein RecA
MFSNPETTPGGKALKFYASMRLDIRKMDTLKDADGAMGNRTKAKVVKNKLAPPFRQAEFDIVFGEGISREGCVIDMGVQFDIIGKSGAFYSYNGNKIAQGREKLRIFLKENPEIMAEIEQKIRDAALGEAVEETVEE